MANRCLLYYITDRRAFPGSEFTRRERLLEKIAEAATHGIDHIQLREKDLSARHLESLARDAMRIIDQKSKHKQHKQRLAGDHPSTATTLLINTRVDVALATAAHGVHLRANDIAPEEVRKVWKQCGAATLARELTPTDPLIAVSCHSPEEVAAAAAAQATFAVFAPVFEKKDAPETPSAGLEALRQACRIRIPVLALGGITLQNAQTCTEAGAAGIAAIRLFQENDIAAVVHQIRG
jgi:thiamine-phosphate pyrophosphorylase